MIKCVKNSEGTINQLNKYGLGHYIDDSMYEVTLCQSELNSLNLGWLHFKQPGLTKTNPYVCIDIFVLDDNGNVPSGEKQRVYNGVFVKNGIQIVEFEQASEFDSEIYFELTYKKFGQTANQSTTFVLPNEKASALTSEQKTFLLSYGIEKFDDGYYVLKPREAVNVDGEYSLTLRYGKVGKETTTFKLTKVKEETDDLD